MATLTYDAESSLYDFETSELKGSLRAQSPDPQVDIRHGISALVHKPSGVFDYSSQVLGAQSLSAVCDAYGSGRAAPVSRAP